MLGYYGKLSTEVYDIDKPIGHSFGDLEFYYDRLKNTSGKILEAGVGTGRLLIPFLEKGLDIEGLDVSNEMLSICRENCKARNLSPRLIEGQMENISLESLYDSIIVPTGTFLLLYERERSIRALKNFYDHLDNNGRLILDISIDKDIKLEDVSTRTWETKDRAIIVLETKIIEIDHIDQYTISHNRYEKWRDGVLIQSELERFPLRWYGVEEFKLILENIGFEDIVISSDYNYGVYPNKDSEIITFEAVVRK